MIIGTKAEKLSPNDHVSFDKIVLISKIIESKKKNSEIEENEN